MQRCSTQRFADTVPARETRFLASRLLHSRRIQRCGWRARRWSRGLTLICTRSASHDVTRALKHFMAWIPPRSDDHLASSSR